MKKHMRRHLPALLAGLALAACGDGAADDELTASGTVEATEADLGFQAAGRISEIGVEEGTAVSGGTELARLDVAEMEAALASSQAQLDAARSRLSEMRTGARPEERASAQAALRAAEERETDAAREADRTARLFEGGAVSQQALDRARTSHEVAAATREQAEQALELVRQGPRREAVDAQSAMVRQAEANVQRWEATLANAIIVAPFPGIITVRHRLRGESVGPGVPVFSLLDPDDRWVRIYVREDEIGRVRLGQTAEIRSDTYPDKTYDGEVTFIGSEAEFTPRNVQTQEERTRLVYPVKVRITGDPSFELKPGIPADVVLVEAAG